MCASPRTKEFENDKTNRGPDQRTGARSAAHHAWSVMAVATTFTTSRLLEFCTVAELTKLVGFGPEDWPKVVIKELIDNALDACEDASIAPAITVAISTRKNTISVSDNGPGIPADTVTRLLDYRNKTSSREAYVAPTRGAQGNALQALLAMAFALDGKRGETTIKACGITHDIVFGIDPVRRVPKIEHDRRPTASVQSGTFFALHWPLLLADGKAEIVPLVDQFAWLNPHATLTLKWDGKVLVDAAATDPQWRKWRPNDPAPAAWYDDESFNRLIAAFVADDEDHDRRDRTVRDFIEIFRGLARTDTRAQVLDAVGAARMSLRDFFTKPKSVLKLLDQMQVSTKPVAAKDLGLLGKDHFDARFKELDVDPKTFQYKRELLDIDEVPYAIEAAFGYCPSKQHRVKILGINWSPSLINPYRELGADGSLDFVLFEQRAGDDEEPIVLALHIAAPRIAYTDKAKSALQLPDEVAAAVVKVVRDVTKTWAKVRKAEERDASRRERREELMTRRRPESQKQVAFEVMEQAYLKVSGPKNLTANARQIMYVARAEIQERSERSLDDSYFTQTLLPDFMAANMELTANWKVAFDDRGHFADPHTGLMIGLGTVAVREYIEDLHELEIKSAAVAPAHVATKGPSGSFGAVLYIEKEGFMALLDEEELAQRFDIAIMSSKGMSVTAARELADEVCHRWRVPLFVLRDFDKAGFSIVAGFKQRQSRRYTFKNQIKVVDLGLRMGDVRHLIEAGMDEAAAAERGSALTRRANMRRNGATAAEAEYLLTRRVELNAFTSEEFIAFVERKLTEHGVVKVVPNKAVLTSTYRTLVQGREVEKIIKRELRKLNGHRSVQVPSNLMAQVEDYLRRNPTHRWDKAVASLVRKPGG